MTLTISAAGKFVIGVDAGNSKTHAVVSTPEGRLVGFAGTGPGNYEAVGMEQAMANIAEACQGAMAMARLKPPAAAACFGLAGADFPEDYPMLEAEVSKLALASQVQVVNDTLPGLRAGSRQPYGVVVVMGAGANAAGRSPSGHHERLLGEGYRFGDWGGGGMISEAMLHHVFRAYDGRGPGTMLTDLVLQALDAPDMEELARRLYRGQLPRDALLALPPLVFDAAYEGDQVAIRLVRQIAEEAALAAIALIRRLGLEREPVPVVLAGSVFKGKGPLLLDLVRARVHEVAPRACISRPKFEPVVGAAIMALEMLGLGMEDDRWHQIEHSASQLSLSLAYEQARHKCD